MRFAPFSTLRSRDGTLQRGPRVVNGYVEASNGKFYAQKRPALALLDATLTGVGGGLWTDPAGSLGTIGVNGTGTAATLFSIQSSPVPPSSWSPLSAVTSLVLGGVPADPTVIFARSKTDVESKASASTLDPAPLGMTQRSSGNFVLQVDTGTPVSSFLFTPFRAITHGNLSWLIERGSLGSNDFYIAYTGNLGANWNELVVTDSATGSPETEGILSFASKLWLYTVGFAFSSSTPATLGSFTQENTSGLGSLSKFGMAATSSAVYAVGGASGSPVALDDVYSASNGKDFSLVTGSPGFPARVDPTVLSLNNALYVIGGLDAVGGDLLDDVWASTNGGVTWTDITPSGLSGVATNLIGVAVNNQIVLLRSTASTNTLYVGDVSTSFEQVALGTVLNPNGVLADFAGGA